MFFDIGPLEVLALVILGVLIFGPEKLPKVIQDAMGFIRKVRAFSENAKEDIRKELGPEFKDFEFEDLNPKNFVRKNLLENEDLGLKEIRNGFDLKEIGEDISSITADADLRHGSANGSASSGTSTPASTTAPDLRKRERASGSDERPPFDADAT